MRRISELTNHYQCLQSNEILHEARKVRFHKFLMMCWRNQMNYRNLRIFESSKIKIKIKINIILGTIQDDQKSRFWDWRAYSNINNHFRLIIRRDYSEYYHPEENVKLISKLLSLCRYIFYDFARWSHECVYKDHRWQQWLFAMWKNPDPGSRFWCLFLWFHELFSKNLIFFISCLRWCFEIDEGNE
jgi:hypothetical protein